MLSRISYQNPSNKNKRLNKTKLPTWTRSRMTTMSKIAQKLRKKVRTTSKRDNPMKMSLRKFKMTKMSKKMKKMTQRRHNQPRIRKKLIME